MVMPEDSDHNSTILTLEGFGQRDHHIFCAIVAATTDQLEYVHGRITLMLRIFVVRPFFIVVLVEGCYGKTLGEFGKRTSS